MRASAAVAQAGRVPVGMSRRLRGRSALDREGGSIGLVVAILAVGMLAMAGLVVDGGAALAARGRAADVAQQAARAGADAIAAGSLRRADPGALTVNAAAGAAAAQQILAVGGVVGEVSVSGDTVTVTATVSRPTAILSAMGIKQVSGHASATATSLYGGAAGVGGGG